MDVKRFVGRSMEEAFRKVRKEFGKNAVILYSYAPDTGFFRKLFGNEKFIIIAGKNMEVPEGSNPASELPDNPESKKETLVDLIKQKYQSSTGSNSSERTSNGTTSSASSSSSSSSSRSVSSSSSSSSPPESTASSVSESAASDYLSEEPQQNGSGNQRSQHTDIGEIESMIEDLTALVKSNEMADCNETLFNTYKKMLKNNISEAIAGNIIEQIQNELPPDQLRDASAIRSAVQGALRSMIRTSGSIEYEGNGNKSVALVGPTGVGKTTTVAKLAGNFALKQQYSVGLITIDTYRLGAAAQLEKVASLLEVPCRAVRNPSEFAETMEEMKNHDLVFIDTLGTSQYDDEKLESLQSFFQAYHPDEIHLVLSANMQDEASADSIEAFSGLDIDRVIFSKLDETNKLGLIINILQRVDAAISYITTGQEIPRDIQEAEDSELARRIIEGGSHA